MRRRVPRLDEAAQHVLNAVPPTIETAPTAVWQTSARPPTSSIDRGSGSVAIERTTRKAAEVDDGEPRLGVAGHERPRSARRRSQRRAGGEGRGGGGATNSRRFTDRTAGSGGGR